MEIFFGENKKNFIIVVIFLLVCMGLYIVFPTANTFQDITSPLFFLVIIPAVFLKLVLKRKIDFLKIEKEKLKDGIKWCFFSAVVLAVVYYGIFNYTDYLIAHSLPDSVKNNFYIFLFYELFLVGIFYFIYEFFFRGVMLFEIKNYLGRNSVIFQALIMGLFFAVSGGLNWDNARFLLAAPLAGVVSYKSGSIWPFVIFGILFSIAIDAFFIKFSN